MLNSVDMGYAEEYHQSIHEPVTFWSTQAKLIDWFTFAETIMSQDRHGNDVWFADGELNTACLALDYHVENDRAHDIALIYDSLVTDTCQKFTCEQLRDKVALFADVLAHLGVMQGDHLSTHDPGSRDCDVSLCQNWCYSLSGI